MKQFYETYKDDETLSPLVRELYWTNNLEIFSRAKSPEEREFYLRLEIRGIVVEDIVELSCVFEYIHTGFYTLKEAIQDEIDKMIEWIDNQEGT